jgi:hypothetical protein
MKGKMKRRNTEPLMLVSPGAQFVLPQDASANHNNTVF